MDALDRLVEQEALRRLKAAYLRLYDLQRWDEWLALFTADATLRVHAAVSGREQEPPVLELVGRGAIGDYIVPLGPSRRTVHHGHTPELDILSATEATGIWAMEDWIDYADRQLHGHGHYHETYRKQDGAWRFSGVHLRRLRLAETPAAATT